MQSQFRQIFVDDNDTAIEYGAGWSLQALKPGDEASAYTPLYDTLHAFLLPDSLQRSNVSFTFNGTDFSAFFEEQPVGTLLGIPMDGITACTVDGVQQKLTFGIDNSISCQTNNSLPDGTHKLFVEVGVQIKFDGIVYTPSIKNSAAGDVVYYPGSSDLKWEPLPWYSSPLSPPGGAVDLDFVGEGQSYTSDLSIEGELILNSDIGYSLGVYADFFYNISSLFPYSDMTYTIDDYPPQDFAIANVPDSSNTLATKIRILQTPSYPMGQHHFHLFFHVNNDTVLPFALNQIIVQNSTAHGTVSLQTFPTTLSAVSSPATGGATTPKAPQEPANGHTKSHVPIWIGIATGIAAILLLISGFICYRWRRRRFGEDADGVIEVVVRPFALSDRRLNDPDKSARLLQSHAPTGRIAVGESQDESTGATAPPAYHTTEEGTTNGIVTFLLFISGITWYRRRKQRTPVDHEDVVEVVVQPFALSNRRPDSLEKSSQLMQSGQHVDQLDRRAPTMQVAVRDHRESQDQEESNSTVVTLPPSYRVAEEAA